MGQISTYLAQSGASRNLGNLANVAINTALLPDTHNTIDFGNDVLRWKNGYFQGTLTVFDLVVESGSSIHLAGATFENQGHYTSVDTNWMVEHDDQDTAFIGVYAESTGVMTHANVVLDAGGTTLNLLKNSPLHPWTPNAAGIVNEDGGYGTFVHEGQDISWQHFDELTKDEYGNVTYMSGIEPQMRLTSHHLLLETVDFQIWNASEDVKVNLSADGESHICGGNLGINQMSPTNARLEVFDDTNPQLRLEQSATNYATFQVNSDGDLRINTNKIGIGKNPEDGIDFDVSGFVKADGMITKNLAISQRQNGFYIYSTTDDDIDLIQWDTLSSGGYFKWDDSAGAYRLDHPLRLNQDNVNLGGVLWLDESVTGPSVAEGGAGHQIWAGDDHKLYWTDHAGNVAALTADGHAHTELWTRAGTELSPTTAGDDVKATKFIVDGVTDYTIYENANALYIAESLIFAPSTQAWYFNDGTVWIGSDMTEGLLELGSIDGGDQGAEIRLHVPADHATDIASYNMEVYEDDLTFGPDTDPDAFKFTGNGTAVTAAFNVDLTVNGGLYVKALTDADSAVGLWSNGIQKGIIGYNATADEVVIAHNETGVTGGGNGIRLKGDLVSVNRGSQNICTFQFDGSNTDIRFTGSKQSNRIGTWINESFQIVTNSAERVTVAKDGKVGIGVTPAYDFHVQRDVAGYVTSRLYNANTEGIAEYTVGANGGGQILLVANSSDSSHYDIPAASAGIAAPWGDKLTISVGDSGSATKMMTFDASAGTIGIGSGVYFDFPDQVGIKLDLYGGNYAIGVESGGELRIASNVNTIFYTGGYTGTEVGRFEAGGFLKVPGGVRAPEFWAPSGSDLKLQPDVGGDVVLFGDTDVDNGENGGMLYVHRRAAEGNEYVRLYVTAGQAGMLHSSANMTLQGQSVFTINSVTKDIVLKVGDNAGSKKVYFKNNDGDAVGIVDSLGNAQFNGTLAIGVGSPDYTAHIAQQDNDSILTLERIDTIIGQGYGVGAIIFKAGETTPNPVAHIRVMATEDWTSTSSPTRMEFHTTRSGSASASHSVAIDENGNLGVGFSDPIATLEVDGGVKAESILLQDGSTIGHSQLSPHEWHIGNARHEGTKDMDTETDGPSGVAFSTDGKKFFVVDNQLDKVFEYDLSTPWDVESATYNAVSFTTTGSTAPQGIYFKADGKKMYLADPGDDEINEYDLATAWDLSFSVTLVGTKSLPGMTPVGIHFRPDGRRVYFSDASSDNVRQYILSIPWDITTATWDTNFGTDIDSVEDVTFSPDGSKMYIVDGSAEDDIHEFTLTTPWDIPTAILTKLFHIWEDATPNGITFRPDGTRMYVVGNANNSLYEYHMGIVCLGPVAIGHGGEWGSLPLDVRSADNNQIVAHDTSPQAAGIGGGIMFGSAYTDAGDVAVGGRISASKVNSTSGNYDFDLVFDVQNTSEGLTERLRLTTDGKIGINTDTPSSLLEIRGDDTELLHLSSSQSYALGSGGGVLFSGRCNSGNNDFPGGYIGVEKWSAGSGELGFDLVFQSHPNSVGDMVEMLRLSAEDGTATIADVVIDHQAGTVHDNMSFGDKLPPYMSTTASDVQSNLFIGEGHAINVGDTAGFVKGFSNILIGDSCGMYLDGTGSGDAGEHHYNILIGDYCGSMSRLDDYNILIGYNAQCVSGTYDDCINIGNLIFGSSDAAHPQLRIGGGIGTAFEACAALEVKSTTGALLVPRMTTTARNAISSKVNGMILYNTSTNEFNFRENGSWVTKN